MQFVNNQFINPINHNTLLSALNDVAFPEQKIKYLKTKGSIQSVMRGWYLVNPSVENYSLFYASNKFYGPSYISMLTALSYWGWIADRTFSYQAICLNRGKEIKNTIGRFIYYKQDADTYSLGVLNITESPNIVIQIASPTKALYDYFQNESNLTFNGKKDLYNFLENDLRFATENLKELDMHLLKELLQLGKKNRQINLLIKLIESL
jgi:predicted transcriptional regulator of viral defense system